ncbi:STAS domain-containing protein [Saccharothrix obliqua]|uniref:STAS domain-containing protein n=1 Tax=Saccharothrix obliqua TaxID=2861747 RepID=UPI001C5EBB8C|nr:STAS domain-containing protein [Saccharothrix obliqua]MBW4720552.1 STAS domain-containing protein [Saccharothrix obliqua]
MRQQPLSVTTAPVDGDTITIAVAGDVAYDTADELRRAAENALRDHTAEDPAPRLVVDCADMTLCDSYGLSVLLMIRELALGHRATLVLDNPPAQLTRLLRRTGVHALLA